MTTHTGTLKAGDEIDSEIRRNVVEHLNFVLAYSPRGSTPAQIATRLFGGGINRKIETVDDLRCLMEDRYREALGISGRATPQ